MSLSLRTALADALTRARIGVMVGFPASIAAFVVFGALLETAGWPWLTSPFVLVGHLACSLVVGLQVAVEVDAVRVDGIDALGRGSRPVALVRCLSAAALVGGFVLFLLAVTAVSLTAALRMLRGETVDPGLLVGLTGAYVLYRGVCEFVDGLRRSAP